MGEENGSVVVDVGPPERGQSLVAVDGQNWSLIQEGHEELLNQVLVRGAIFARMKPDQKQQLVTHLQALGYYVGKFVYPLKTLLGLLENDKGITYKLK